MPHHEEAQLFLQELLESMRDIPIEPSLLNTLFTQTAEGAVISLDGIAQTIEQGAGLATRVLAMANSAYYGLQADVSSVSRAVAVLGLQEVRALVLSLAANAVAAGRPLPESFDLRAYWHHQVSVAITARLIAEEFGGADPDTLYTAGLLHDLGKLLIAAYRPNVWDGIKALCKDLQIPDIEAEDRYWGIDHSLVASHVLAYWNLPPTLTEPISWHHQPNLAGEHKHAAAIIFSADSMLHHPFGKDISLPEPAGRVLHHLIPDKKRFMENLEERLDEEKINALVSHLV